MDFSSTSFFQIAYPISMYLPFINIKSRWSLTAAFQICDNLYHTWTIWPPSFNKFLSMYYWREPSRIRNFVKVHHLQSQRKFIERYMFLQTLSPLVYLYRYCVCFSLTISLTHLLIVNKTLLTFDTLKCRYFLYSVYNPVFIIAVYSTLCDSNPSHWAKILIRACF